MDTSRGWRVVPAVGLALLLSAAASAAPSPETGLVLFTDGEREARVEAPPGWALATRTDSPAVELVFQRQAGDRALFVRLVPKPAGDVPDAWDRALAPFRKDHVLGSLSLTERTGDDRRANVWRFVFDDGQPSYSVAVLEEERATVLFGSRASSLSDLQDDADDLRGLVNSYRVERLGLGGTLDRARSRWGNHALGIAGILLPVMMWCGLSWLLALTGGWISLARTYAARDAFHGATRGTMGYVGGNGYRYLTVGSDETGLHIHNIRMLRPGHRPLFFPWGEVEDVTVSRGSFWSPGPHAVFRFRRSRVTVRLPPRHLEWLEAAAGRTWPVTSTGHAVRTGAHPPGTRAGARVP